MRYSIGTAIGLTLLLAVGAAQAKSARCFVSDEGAYPCRFKAAGGGGFEISAPGKSWYSLVVDEKGVAFGYANYGTGRNVALPGRFYRQADDPACWKNASTGTRICAW